MNIQKISDTEATLPTRSSFGADLQKPLETFHRVITKGAVDAGNKLNAVGDIMKSIGVKLQQFFPKYHNSDGHVRVDEVVVTTTGGVAISLMILGTPTAVMLASGGIISESLIPLAVVSPFIIFVAFLLTIEIGLGLLALTGKGLEYLGNKFALSETCSGNPKSDSDISDTESESSYYPESSDESEFNSRSFFSIKSDINDISECSKPDSTTKGAQIESLYPWREMESVHNECNEIFASLSSCK